MMVLEGERERDIYIERERETEREIIIMETREQNRKESQSSKTDGNEVNANFDDDQTEQVILMLVYLVLKKTPHLETLR